MSKRSEKEMSFQRELVKKLRGNEVPYEEASVYTVLLDLVDGNGLIEVFTMLQNVAVDLDLDYEFNFLTKDYNNKIK